MHPSPQPPLIPGFHAVPAGYLACIVTALEMHSAPPLGAITAPAGFVLCRQTAPTPVWYHELFRRIGAPWLWTSRLSLKPDKLEAILSSPNVEIFTLRDDATGAEIALLELDFLTSEQCEIAFLGMETRYRHQGLGRYMMNFALHRAWQHQGVQRVWIHTCTLDDPAALSFYQSAGFVPFARQVEIVADPRLSGVLPSDCAPLHPIL